MLRLWAATCVMSPPLCGQRQVLGAGLSPDLQPARLGPRDLLRWLRTGDVEDLDRHIECLGECDDPRNGLALSDDRLAPGMVFGRCESCSDQLLGHPRDQLVMLGVHAHQRLVAARRRQHAQNRAVIQPDTIIGHEDLDRAAALFHKARQFLIEHRRRRIGDRQMEGVVDDRLAGSLVIVRRDGRKRLPVLLPRERDHGGGASGRR